eukprot:g4763.t1
MESQRIPKTTPVDSERTSYGDAFSLLKHCNPATLRKLCGTFTDTDNSNVAYANFPKRSLVKCFSARDKYEWHMAKTAELENLSRRWEDIEEQIKRRSETRQKRQIHSSKERRFDSIVGESSYPHKLHSDDTGPLVQLKTSVKSRQGGGRRKHRRPSPLHNNKTPRRETPSPLIVNEDVLQEALMIAETVQISDESDLPSPLSSCLKTQSDSSEADVIDSIKGLASFKFPNYRQKGSHENLVHGSVTNKVSGGGGSGSGGCNSSTRDLVNMTQFATDFAPRKGGQLDSSIGGKSHDRVAGGFPVRETGGSTYGFAPFNTTEQINTSCKAVTNKADMAKRAKPSLSTPPVKSLTNASRTPRGVQKKIEKVSNNTSFRGSLSQCLIGARHESVDFTSSPNSSMKSRGITRQLSQTRESQISIKSHLKKASSFGGHGTGGNGGGGGSVGFGNLHPSSISGTSGWK